MDGRFVYVCPRHGAEARESGQYVFRLMVLSETWEPHRASIVYPTWAKEGPAMSDRPKLKLDLTSPRSQGMEQTAGPRTVDPLLQRQGKCASAHLLSPV